MITRRSALALFSGGLAGATLAPLTALPNRPVKKRSPTPAGAQPGRDARIRWEGPTLRAEP